VERDHGPLTEGVESFHSTRWTIVMRAAQSQAPWGQSALAELCRLYWYPLYTFARRRGRSPEVDRLESIADLTTGVSRGTLRSRAEDNEASGLGMHQADAGSDAYDRDFALNLLSQEQDALYEVEEALKRVDAGTYGICEMSGSQFHKLDLRPSHLQDLRSNARLKLRNDKRQCTSGSLSNPFSA
jgi:RNA polymerase-binding transcription factor DksA